MSLPAPFELWLSKTKLPTGTPGPRLGSYGLKIMTEGKHETCHSFLAEEKRKKIKLLSNVAAHRFRKEMADMHKNSARLA